ncbi:DNA helicase ATP-dependent Ku type [Penicillium bovifimosum]|uniref:ATP-dependent DNA helicase II subunit 1 n=1 Tax=Penicillium bovifimosum TaxID=126998 RepID=A0A9W9HG27_9EURO|nr:DNA helicase ATP-dependent Ku type [Penicillium bovifimosum]KAJ5146038.1 DNA helicase ATP-dependent Ku type [Penicillium bovifimosum]
MADDSYSHEEDNNEEEELDQTSFKSVKDAVLFAIDISNSMLTPRPSPDPQKHRDESPASAALKCAYHLMQQRIISNPHDMIGVLLYGTKSSKFYDESEESRGDLSYPHCYLYTDLDIPSALEVKQLRSLASPEDGDSEVHQVLQASEEPVSMANVLFCANQIFTSKAPNFLSRRLFVVTDNDNPHADNKALRSAATVRARDLYDLGVNIELFPISQPDHEFDTSKFYDASYQSSSDVKDLTDDQQDIIYKTSPSDGDAPAYLRPDTNTATAKGDGLSLLNSLLSSINSRSVPRRSLFSNVPLEIGPGFKISVNGYLLLKKQEPSRSCFVWQGGETPQIAKGVTTLTSDDTAQAVEKTVIRKAYKFGGEQVSFTAEEQQALRNFGDPVIRIIGFKPLSALPIWANVKHPSFIYPSEEDYIGSTRVFSALHQKLLDSEKLALVWFIPRKNGSPALAAMVAGAEKVDDNGVQKYPPGMWIIPLPFADDVRQNPESTVQRAADHVNDAMRDVIRQLQLPKAIYEPSKYPNPSLQWHYRILQAIALDEDAPEAPEDKTVPKYRQIHKRSGDYILKWADELKLQANNMFGGRDTTSTLVKRGAKAEPAAAHPSKRAKVEGGTSVVEAEMRRFYEQGTISKLTLPVLKEFLHMHGRANAGRKADLVDRVEQYFEQKF